MLNGWDKQFPGRIETMFRSIQNVAPSHLADTRLYDFINIRQGEIPAEGGDMVFDRENMDLPARKTISILDSRPLSVEGKKHA